MVTTHKRSRSETITLKKKKQRGKNHRIPPNQYNRQKHKEKETMETQSYQKTKNKMTIGKPHTSIITLNVNGLNSPITRYRVAD